MRPSEHILIRDALANKEVTAYSTNGARRIASRIRLVARNNAARFCQKVGRDGGGFFHRFALHPIHRCARGGNHGQTAMCAIARLFNDMRLGIHARKQLHGNGTVFGRTRHANGIHALGHTSFLGIGHKRQGLIGIALNAIIVVSLEHVPRTNIRFANRRSTKHIFRFHCSPSSAPWAPFVSYLLRASFAR